jgi:hypothetical protein
MSFFLTEAPDFAETRLATIDEANGTRSPHE